MVVGLTKWGSAGLSYSDPSQHSNKILCKLAPSLGRRFINVELQQALETFVKRKLVQEAKLAVTED